MNWLARMLYGRNGIDPLCIALLICGFVISFIARFFRFTIAYPILMLVSYVFTGLLIFRVFSRNIAARQRENRAFLRIWSPVVSWFRMRHTISADAMHKYFRCPNCREYVRIPKGVGRVRIRCKRCMTEFERKT